MSADDGDESLTPLVQFRPGWPDIAPLGLIVARTFVTQRTPENNEDIVDDEVDWVLHLGVREESPRLAMLGDLTVESVFGFAGVTVALPFELRDEPVEITEQISDEILRQYGEWVSSVMYDHAATVMRTALAGNGFGVFVPYGTPEVQLHTSDLDREPPGGD